MVSASVFILTSDRPLRWRLLGAGILGSLIGTPVGAVRLDSCSRESQWHGANLRAAGGTEKRHKTLLTVHESVEQLSSIALALVAVARKLRPSADASN
jgi:hypothetical protein